MSLNLCLFRTGQMQNSDPNTVQNKQKLSPFYDYVPATNLPTLPYSRGMDRERERVQVIRRQDKTQMITHN